MNEEVAKAIGQLTEQYGEAFKEMAKTGDAISYDDRLEAIFDMQFALDQRIINDRGINKGLSEWVIGLTLAMESEIDEIRREVNWKWWKNEKDIDHDALRGEVIDMWHFLISLSQKVGLTPADVYRVYKEKNAENHARQDGTSTKEGYANTTKPAITTRKLSDYHTETIIDLDAKEDE